MDAETGEPLRGASIRVAYDGGSDSYDLYTNDAGTAPLSHLKSGTYTVTEITAPDVYLLDTTSQSIKLEAGKKATITVKNKCYSPERMSKNKKMGKLLKTREMPGYQGL